MTLFYYPAEKKATRAWRFIDDVTRELELKLRVGGLGPPGGPSQRYVTKCF